MAVQTEIVRAVLFDIDGTLSDSDDLLVRKVEQTLNPLLFCVSSPKKHAFARWLVMTAESPGNLIYNLADRFDLDSFFVKTLNRISINKKHRIKKYWLINGADALLSHLAGNFHMGIVSARDKVSTMAFIDHFQLGSHFKVVVTSQTCRHTKPFPDPLLYAAESLGIPPEACLMVGDTTVDMKAAKRAGMQAVGVLCGFGRRKELERAGADQILNHTSDLLDLMYPVKPTSPDQ